MHEIEPHYGWRHIYESTQDPINPFHGKIHSEFEFSETIYNHFIHPQWDFFGSETLYLKIIYLDQDQGSCIIELLGEWNDAINNDIMHLKRNILDELVPLGISKFLMIGENVFNFHGSDDSYYEEWFEDVEDGWIVFLNFQEHVLNEMSKYQLDYYANYGEHINLDKWRTIHPKKLIILMDQQITKLLGS